MFACIGCCLSGLLELETHVSELLGQGEIPLEEFFCFSGLEVIEEIVVTLIIEDEVKVGTFGGCCLLAQ